MQFSIRVIKEQDAEVVAELSVQLGYSISVQQTLNNIQLVLNSANDVAYVALDENIVIGWIHIFYTARIETVPFCEIGGLVVDEEYRGKGIGKLLIEQAKEWALRKGCSNLRVRTNVKRKETHKFYSAAGLKEVKEQKIFQLEL